MYNYIIDGLPQFMVGVEHSIAAKNSGFKKQIGLFYIVTPHPICPRSRDFQVNSYLMRTGGVGRVTL